MAGPLSLASPLASPGTTSFVQRLLDFTVRLADASGVNQPNQFANGTNTVKLSGLRASVRVQNSGTPKGTDAQVSIYGMTLEMMNQLATLGMRFSLVPRNELTITAGDKGSGMSLVFNGTIIRAYGDFQGAPDVPFRFECVAGTFNAVFPAKASSFPQATTVESIMKAMSLQMGVGFENNGVNVTLPPSYFPGSLGTQWQKVATDAKIGAGLVVGAGGGGPGLVLAIWPLNGSRGGVAPVIAPGRGMIGYPIYTADGVAIKTIYNPQIGFFGQVVVEDSEIRGANGTWIVHKLDHALDSMMPNGLWESTVYCYATNVPNPTPVIPPR